MGVNKRGRREKEGLLFDAEMKVRVGGRRLEVVAKQEKAYI